jgi:hypothetical protein
MSVRNILVQEAGSRHWIINESLRAREGLQQFLAVDHDLAAADAHASGYRTALFEDRGTGARGCRLDEAALAEATARVEGSLKNAPPAPGAQQIRQGRM